MIRRYALAILFGALLGIALLAGIKWTWYRSTSKDTLKLNDQISQQRANAIVMAARRVGPAVVSITVTQTRIVTVSPFPDDFFNNFFRDFFPERRYQEQVKSLGSGVIIADDGYIVTNEHVVNNATAIVVTLPAGQRLSGQIVATDHTNDLALLKIEGHGLPFAELGNSDDLMIGEWVIALGNPFAFLLEDTKPTVTVGVVSALNRSIKSNQEDRIFRQMIQTDAAINPGNSGGPLINVLGQVIGINTFIFTSGGGSEGIGFARPVSIVRKFIIEAQRYGRVRTPWIGIWTDEALPTRSSKGALIAQIDEGSPASRSGLLPGDLVKAVNGIPVSGPMMMERLLTGLYVGDTVTVDYLRNQENFVASLVVTEFAEPAGFQTNQGLTVAEIQPYFVKKFGLGYRTGVVVIKLADDSIAERAGFQPGDVVLRIGTERIRRLDDFKQALRLSGALPWIVSRAGILLQIIMENK